jgi:hypothetical protein
VIRARLLPVVDLTHLPHLDGNGVGATIMNVLSRAAAFTAFFFWYSYIAILSSTE